MTDGIEQESASLYGYFRASGWLPVGDGWEPNIGQWYYGAYDCAEWSLKREIAKAVDERAIAMTGDANDQNRESQSREQLEDEGSNEEEDEKTEQTTLMPDGGTVKDGIEQIAVAKCLNCGYVYGDDLEYRFPNPSECLKCGAETENTTVADAETVESLADDGLRPDGGTVEDDIEYPDDTDEGEVFDLVVRKGPISFDALMDQIWTYSQDEAYTHLLSLEEKGYVSRRDGDLERDGTTREQWYVDTEADRDD